MTILLYDWCYVTYKLISLSSRHRIIKFSLSTYGSTSSHSDLFFQSSVSSLWAASSLVGMFLIISHLFFLCILIVLKHLADILKMLLLNFSISVCPRKFSSLVPLLRFQGCYKPLGMMLICLKPTIKLRVGLRLLTTKNWSSSKSRNRYKDMFSCSHKKLKGTYFC